MIFQKGVYSPCNVCKQKPHLAPLWQLKADKIIQDKKDKGIYNTSLSLPENKELREKGMYEKYGHTYSFHVESIRNKIQEGNLEKFGHISPFGNYDVSNKAKLTLKNKYGVDNPFKSKEIQDRTKT